MILRKLTNTEVDTYSQVFTYDGVSYFKYILKLAYSQDAKRAPFNNMEVDEFLSEAYFWFDEIKAKFDNTKNNNFMSYLAPALFAKMSNEKIKYQAVKRGGNVTTESYDERYGDNEEIENTSYGDMPSEKVEFIDDIHNIDLVDEFFKTIPSDKRDFYWDVCTKSLRTIPNCTMSQARTIRNVLVKDFRVFKAAFLGNTNKRNTLLVS